MKPKLLCLAFVFNSAAGLALAQTSRPFNEVLASHSPGQRLLTPFNDLNAIPVLPITLTSDPDSPQFIISDKPEYFRTGDGIALQETVKPGVVRLYVYHCPLPKTKAKNIAAVIENLSDQPMKLEMLHQGAPPPSGDYHALAKAALVQYFDDAAPKPQVVTLEPHARRYIDEKLSNTSVASDILVHGLYEFRIDQPARITTFEKEPGAPLESMDKLEKLPPLLPGSHASGAGRGLFPTSNIDGAITDGNTYDTADGVRQIIVADGKTDPWIAGHDGYDGAVSYNKGNYGVMYRFKLKVKSSNGQKLALLLSNGRGTKGFCDVAGAVVKLSGQTIPLPRDVPRFAMLPEACMIGTVSPTKEPTEVELIYTPPGASCLPLPILLVPFE